MIYGRHRQAASRQGLSRLAERLAKVMRKISLTKQRKLFERRLEEALAERVTRPVSERDGATLEDVRRRAFNHASFLFNNGPLEGWSSSQALSPL